MPKYMKISSSGIRIGQSASCLYSAVAIASADAFFLVIGKSAFRMGMEASGGLGGLLGTALDRLGKKKLLVEAGTRVVEKTSLEDLPEEITGHPDWPIAIEQGPMIVIPRESVISVRYSFWQWGIFVQTEKVEFRIEPPFFGRKKVLKFLGDVGWKL